MNQFNEIWARARVAAAVALVAASAGCGGEPLSGEDFAKGDPSIGSTEQASGFFIDPYKSVLIRHVGVVDDPTRTHDPCEGTRFTDISNRYWFFGYLMSQMTTSASSTAYSDFAKSWLNSWKNSTTLNGDPLVEVKPSTENALAKRVLDAWLSRSGGTTLSMSMAPFRLLAIANRFDLRKGPRRFGEGASGELRFVFSVLDLNDGCQEFMTPGGDKRGEELVILEYAVDISTAQAKRDWILSWTALTDYEPGTNEFNQALQNLTQQVVVRGKGGSSRANGSALIRIRTNETANPDRWDLREFNINASTHLVVPAVVKQTPRNSLNCVLNPPSCSNDLALYMQENSPAILADTYVVPNTYRGKPFLGSHSTNRVGTTYWAGGSPAVPSEVRHQFSKNTCSGCHSAETGTFFSHVRGREKGEEALLSPFVTGYKCLSDGFTGCTDGEPHCVADPVDPNGPVRCFNEMNRRVNDILSYLNSGI